MKILVFLFSFFAIYKSRRKTTPLLIVAATLCVFSFLNFGSFHLPRKELIHYWDTFHYYIGAKYFKELGYTSLYNSSYIAGKEKGAFREISAVRELNSYEIIPTNLIDPAKIKARFSEERWLELTNDVFFFIQKSDRSDSAWQKLLVDHGFNAPPFKTAFMSVILNLYPLNDFTLALTIGIDYLLVLLLIGFIGVNLGWYHACLFTITFSLNPIAPFDYTFGSVMRYDWLLFLGLGSLFALQDKFQLAGLFLALSTHCRIFPLLFALTLAIGILNQRKNLIRFIFSYIITALVCLGFSLLFLKDLGYYKEYSNKMKVHSEKIFSNTVGIRQVVLSDYALHSLAKDPYSEDELSTMIKDRRLLSSLIGLFLSLLALIITKDKGVKRSLLAAMILIFSLINPVNYYYAFLALLTFFMNANILLFIFMLGQFVVMNEGSMLIQNIYFSLLTILILLLEPYFPNSDSQKSDKKAVIA